MLASTDRVVLSTDGPAEIQAEALRCEALGLLLYALVARASDLLFNLESTTLVVATADDWQARGTAYLLPRAKYPEQLKLIRLPEAAWSELIEIQLTRLQLRSLDGRSPVETLDISGRQPDGDSQRGLRH
jgi:hypothetical protein